MVIDDAGGGVHFEAETLGVLQVADGWASITARGRLRPLGAERGATVIIDSADPLDADHAAAVIVDIEGGYRMRARVEANAVKVIVR